MRFERAKGRSGLNPAIRKFRKTGAGSVRVLLLPIDQGANGLNLVEAQHVILIEPLLNPAVEAQAVGRVHRIGQTRPTFVHRFIIEGSVEEGVLSLGRKKAEADGGEMMGLRNTRKEDAVTLGDLGLLFGKEGEGARDGVGSEGERLLEEAFVLPSLSEDTDPTMHNLFPGEAAAVAAEARRQAALQRVEE